MREARSKVLPIGNYFFNSNLKCLVFDEINISNLKDISTDPSYSLKRIRWLKTMYERQLCHAVYLK